jgi:hypothetical protein
LAIAALSFVAFLLLKMAQADSHANSHQFILESAAALSNYIFFHPAGPLVLEFALSGET